MQTSTVAFDVASLVTSLNSAVGAADVLTLIGTCVGVGVGFVLTWFGARKLIRVFFGALKKGKISV